MLVVITCNHNSARRSIAAFAGVHKFGLFTFGLHWIFVFFEPTTRRWGSAQFVLLKQRDDSRIPKESCHTFTECSVPDKAVIIRIEKEEPLNPDHIKSMLQLTDLQEDQSTT